MTPREIIAQARQCIDERLQHLESDFASGDFPDANANLIVAMQELQRIWREVRGAARVGSQEGEL